MTKYHVGTSDITGAIFAGVGNVQDCWIEWKEKREVTSEAINAVMSHMLNKLKPGENSTAYMNRTLDGKYVRLKLEVSEHKPEWLDEEGGRADDQTIL